MGHPFLSTFPPVLSNLLVILQASWSRGIQQRFNVHTRSIFRTTNPYDSSDKGHGTCARAAVSADVVSTSLCNCFLQRNGLAGFKLAMVSEPMLPSHLLSLLLSSLPLLCHCWCRHASFAASHCSWNHHRIYE